jgi:hypothetical protein
VNSFSLLNLLGSAWFLAILLILAIAIAGGGLALARKQLAVYTLAKHHDVSGSVLSVVGTLYAVVLGFLVVGSFNTFETARLTTQHEADSLRDIFHLSLELPPATRNELRGECVNYADAMINDEWKTMQEGFASGSGRQAMFKLWTTTCRFEPKTNREINLQAAILTQLGSMSDARHQRLIKAAPEYGPIIWGVLLFGAAITVLLTYVFDIEQFGLHVCLTCLVTLIIGLNLILVALFSYPYSGDVSVSPYCFVVDRQDFANELKGLNCPLPSIPLLPPN